MNVCSLAHTQTWNVDCYFISDGQLAERRLVTVLDAVVNNEIEVAYFIDPPMDSSITVAYTVSYSMYLFR